MTVGIAQHCLLSKSGLTILAVWFCLSVLAVFNQPQHLNAAADYEVVRFTVNGTINPAINDYLRKGLEKAEAGEAKLVIIQMDTPGGLDRSMRDIIQAILASSIPVVSYVAPDGARAASAGTYILYASHVAAMAPATNLGAATPIQIGAMPGTTKPDEMDDQDKENGKALPQQSTLEKKVINDASAYIKALADRHGRNGDWAVKAVRESVSLSAKEALEIGVIDVIASDINDLLAKIDGHEVAMNGYRQTLATKNMTVTDLEPGWRYRVLSVISDPNVAYLLFLLGIYGLIYELANPGFLLPGVAGGISLMLALYAFQILPINYAGLALIILGLVFLVSEAFLPSFGSLGIGGIISFFVGSLILMDDENLKISFSLIAGISVVSAACILLLAGRFVSLKGKKVRTGREAMIGKTGEAQLDFFGSGRIWVYGESWQARSERPVHRGDTVVITSVDDLELTVEPLKEEH
jgi:membrane-bound serine protease (ClpP class)